MIPTTSAAHRPPYRSQTEPAVHLSLIHSWLAEHRALPDGFMDTMNAPSPNIMNKMQRCVLGLSLIHI